MVKPPAPTDSSPAAPRAATQGAARGTSIAHIGIAVRGLDDRNVIRLDQRAQDVPNVGSPVREEHAPVRASRKLDDVRSHGNDLPRQRACRPSAPLRRVHRLLSISPGANPAISSRAAEVPGLLFLAGARP